jgi:aspartyl-tRNA(Asn)/glutamyl-tRNA(Gln) amidotransferase subunit A
MKGPIFENQIEKYGGIRIMTTLNCYSSIKEVSDLIRSRKISPVQVVETTLERIEELNPTLNAFITVLAEDARAQAKIAEEEINNGNWRGPLHGIPVGIKDFYDTKGIKTTAAFEHFKDRIPKTDAAGVSKIKAAGGIIVGKMNMHTLGMGTTGLESYFGPALNPWNSEYIPGGSSSGSAAAVASGMCYATLDTDAIGSCRLPAACCGVVGFKGTYGLISSEGILAGEKTDKTILLLSHPGITTRSIDDTSLVLDVLSERTQQSQTKSFFEELSEDRMLRIGVATNFTADEEVKSAFEDALKTIGDFGYPTSNVTAPFADPNKGIDNIEEDRKTAANQIFKDIDILLLPTTTTTVPRINDASKNPQALSPQNTAFVNYYGLPSVSIPCGLDRHGLPLSFQIISRPWNEKDVLYLAHKYQINKPFDYERSAVNQINKKVIHTI